MSPSMRIPGSFIRSERLARTPRTCTSGFTLVEVAITLIIVGVLAAIGAPMFKALTLNQGIKAGAYDLVSALEFTRSEAIKRNTTVSLRAGATADGAWTTGWRLVDPSSNILRSWNLVSTINVTEPGGATVITFGRDGHMTAPTTAPKLQVDAIATVSGVTPRCVQVDLIGRAKSQSGSCP